MIKNISCGALQTSTMFLDTRKHSLKTKSFDLSIFFSERRDAIYYVTIAMEIFSFVTIFTCEEIMFSRETSSGISLFFIQKNILPQLHYSQVYFIPFTMLVHALWFWLRFLLWFIAHSTRVTRDKRVKTVIFVTKEINT